MKLKWKICIQNDDALSKKFKIVFGNYYFYVGLKIENKWNNSN